MKAIASLSKASFVTPERFSEMWHHYATAALTQLLATRDDQIDVETMCCTAADIADAMLQEARSRLEQITPKGDIGFKAD